MYKVFFNDCTIQIGVEDKKSFKDNIAQIIDCQNNKFVSEIVSQIESGQKTDNLVIVDQQNGPLWDCFKSQLTQLPAAGGLVMRRDRSLLFIRRLGVWDLPKGKIESGETPEAAAIREVEEECGARGLEIIRPLDSTFHMYRSPYLRVPDNLVLKETKWFLMSCDDQQQLTPQADEDIEEVRWFSIDDLDLVMQNTYASLREFLQKTLSVIV